AGKGRIAEGYDADLVLFDAARITDHADFSTPLAPNEGIVRVYVEGHLAVENDKATGVKNGRLLRA
ncbi:MAG: amidohydrolase, partial [Eubacteriales bacterium]|nr:amidohydrolase [Eubacteriales bacterium]